MNARVVSGLIVLECDEVEIRLIRVALLQWHSGTIPETGGLKRFTITEHGSMVRDALVAELDKVVPPRA